MFRAVQDLDRVDRLIFRYYFWEGYSVSEICSCLRSKHFEALSPVQVMGRLAAAESRLSSDHRWRLITGLLRSVPPLSIDRPRSLVREDVPFELPDSSSDPEAHVRRSDATDALRGLIEDLPKQERMALQLKFGRGLSARAVAGALGIRNYKRIYEIQGRALAKLAAGLKQQGIELSDFGPSWQEMDFL
jgi:RNA polymerase sigma factor (sigma-70 family)